VSATGATIVQILIRTATLDQWTQFDRRAASSSPDDTYVDYNARCVRRRAKDGLCAIHDRSWPAWRRRLGVSSVRRCRKTDGMVTGHGEVVKLVRPAERRTLRLNHVEDILRQSLRSSPAVSATDFPGPSPRERIPDARSSGGW
jgi:hypothetical protein